MNNLKTWSIIMLTAITIPFFSACDGKTDKADASDSIQVDSLVAYFQKIDSLKNNGQLFHIDVYEIGKLGTVFFDVYNITSGNESAQYLNLKKDCGGQYVYDWEDAILIKGEIKYLMTAIDTLVNNFNRKCTHEERYIYLTKDDIRLFSTSWENHDWTASLSVDYRKSNSTTPMKKEDLEKLRNLLKRGEAIIDSLENAASNDSLKIIKD